MLTRRNGPSATNWPGSSSGEPIVKVPAATTSISGQSAQSRKELGWSAMERDGINTASISIRQCFLFVNAAPGFGAPGCSKWLISPLHTSSQGVQRHLAILLPGAPPAVLKMPPAYKVGPVPSSKSVTAFTREKADALPAPPPSADHCVPFHLARLLNTTPPALLNAPPEYRAGPTAELVDALGQEGGAQ